MWIRVISGEILKRLEELQDKARELGLEFILDGEVLLRDTKNDKTYLILDIEADAEDHGLDDYVGDFPMTLDFKLCREVDVQDELKSTATTHNLIEKSK